MEELGSVPARLGAVELQLVQHRTEMRAEFSEIRQRFEGVEQEFANVRADMTKVRDELRAEIRAGDEETRRYMRVLHEDVIARLAATREGRSRRKTSR